MLTSNTGEKMIKDWWTEQEVLSRVRCCDAACQIRRVAFILIRSAWHIRNSLVVQCGSEEVLLLTTYSLSLIIYYLSLTTYYLLLTYARTHCQGLSRWHG